MTRRKGKKEGKKAKKSKSKKPLLLSLIALIGFLIANYSNVQSIVQDTWHILFPKKAELITSEAIYLNPEGESSWTTIEDTSNDDSTFLEQSETSQIDEPVLGTVTSSNSLSYDDTSSTVGVDSWILDEESANDFYDESSFDLTGSVSITDVGFDEYLYYDDSGYDYIYDYDDYYNLYDRTAFSTRTFIYSYDSNPIRLNKIQTEIINCIPIKEGVIDVEMAIVNNALKFYALNNGWGILENQIAEIDCSIYHAGNHVRLDWNEIGSLKFYETDFSLKPGEIFEFAEVLIDTDAFLNILDSYDVSHVNVSATSGDSGCGNQLSYDNYYGLVFDLLGTGPEENLQSVELFSVLNVDEATNALQKGNQHYVRTYVSPSSFPQIDDTFAVETIIAPTKSCQITCRNIFDFGKFVLITDPIDVTLYVPIYAKKYIYTDGGEYGILISELAEMQNPTPHAILQITNKYRYRAENFKIQVLDEDDSYDW